MPDIIPTITLHQPWASWILWGWKTIETRTHARFSSIYDQRIAIHAGKRFDPDAIRTAEPWLDEDRIWRTLQDWASGVILCTAYVEENRPLNRTDSPAAMCDCSEPGLWGLILTDIQPVTPPIPAKGRQGIWYSTEAEQ